ncbi:FtsX-like permease family protein [Nocardioides sp. LHG3406-4]|uniref:FtsX-like permease family protein n=1 Tax=Nocardioides sp. LHG3406-4 TaxID=2804575 RepID=UPI003CF902CD
MSGMTMLARRSLSHRKPAFLATFVVVFLSALMVGSFAHLAEIAQGDGLVAADRDTLTIMGLVIGGWGAVLAVFAVSSTLSVAVRGRDTEIALLRSIGATPRQMRRLLRREVLVVAALAAGAGVALSWPVGALLLDQVRAAGMVADSVTFEPGLIAMAATFLAVVGVSLLAAGTASRRVTSGTARSALATADSAPQRSRWRTLGGSVLVLYGVSAGFVTFFVTGNMDDPFAAMSTAGSAGLIVSVGLAAFAAPILRGLTRVLTPVLGRAGVSGDLAALATRHRSHLLGPVFGGAAVFTATGTSVLMLVGIDARSFVLPEGMLQAEADSIFFLNNVVVGMIAVFCAVVLVNGLLAVIADRRAEFGRVRLVGGTPGQVRQAVLIETLLVSALGVATGLVASLATVLPFSLVRDEGVVPNGQLWLPALMAVIAIGLTVGVGRFAVTRAVRPRALEVVA